jgi:hypothetical protein
VTVENFISVDASRDRQSAAGWNVGEVATGMLWLVTGTRGENLIGVRPQGKHVWICP